jgi:hypothetical protein
MYVSNWNGEPVEVWEDADGDVGVMDSRGYSIVIHRKSAHVLMEWLAKHERRRVNEEIRRVRKHD